ncbi:Mobile element protein [Dissulfuribacter thermophilus]|uniref:Mobile element protein n=1 Tax=Dissulfuribacter thermophilus TaxID=1156395 RepID=A0A1B9F2L8_9BACT|nr:Mobile element protein [Dissulfuribacter thermophilus]
MDLFIIDEIGFKKVLQDAVDEFFEIVKRRHESGSIIITTNRSSNAVGTYRLKSASQSSEGCEAPVGLILDCYQ